MRNFESVRMRSARCATSARPGGAGFATCPDCGRRVKVIKSGGLAAHGSEPPQVTTFADIDAGRKRYDPHTDGYGNPRVWKGDFFDRMGWEEAARIVEEAAAGTPRQILGVSLSATWDDIVRAYRRRALATHPDRAKLNGLSIEEATEAFKKVHAAFVVLQREFRR